jgi:hypothetical protein
LLDKKVGEKIGVFIEWIGDFRSDEAASHLLNAGAPI